MLTLEEAVSLASPRTGDGGEAALDHALESFENYYLALEGDCTVRGAGGVEVAVPGGAFVAVSKETGEVRRADVGDVPFYVSGREPTDDELDIEGARFVDPDWDGGGGDVWPLPV